MPTWAALLLLGCGVLVMLRVISMLRRGRVAGILLMFLLTLAFAGAAMFMFMPAGHGTPSARLAPPIPPVPKAELPPAPLDADPVSFELSVENMRKHGDRLAQSARIKIQAGAEAINEVAQKVAEQTRALVRQHPVPPVPDVAHRVVDGVRRARPAGLAASGLMAFAIGALLYLGYIFLDAGTRGHFTWSLRIVSVVTFAALCLALSILRHGL